MRSILPLLALSSAASAACPYMMGAIDTAQIPAGHHHIKRDLDLAARQTTPSSVPSGEQSTVDFLDQFIVNDTDQILTSDVGGPISDQTSLKAGQRGPTLLEDFIFRQKIQHFDHERVPERAVHARGAGAHGVFTSYADWSDITAASFLSAAGKETPMFVRMSTVAGERGSVDTARDVHGFATRFYTDEGNFDIVGNNIPVFFIQDAILFPDLIHAVKPMPNNQIPQAATAHDSAWDFFSQQPSTLHTLMWAIAGYGTPRSFRHMDAFGVHTYRLVTNDGQTKLVKWHWKSMQGKASLLWEEAQITGGKNSDFHRQDLWNAIEAGQFPSWELGVQIMDESQQLAFGFDLFDPTKIVPEEIVPVTPLGKMTLNLNPTNYFAETEQVMFQPGHIVRGIDFTEDPLLQGRLFSYLDTQLNRNGGPNFEQLPVNRPRVPVHNNNRDGFSQQFIPSNVAPYFPNTLNNNSPFQANQTVNNGFFTAPGRTVSGPLLRTVSPTFADVWSQPRLFFNSLIPVEQQFLINAMRFETSHIQSPTVKQNVIVQLNRISNDLARRVALALGLSVPAPDPTFYNQNTTAFVSILNNTLPTIVGLNVGILTTTSSNSSLSQALALSQAFTALGVNPTIVGEHLGAGITQTYSAADATGFDGIIVTAGTESLFLNSSSTLFPAGRPQQILVSGFRWGKPVGALGSAATAFQVSGISTTPGVYLNATTVPQMVSDFQNGLKQFKFLDRFPVDNF